MAVKHLPVVGRPTSPLGTIPIEEHFYRNSAALFGLPR
jgi:hypothetical protein